MNSPELDTASGILNALLSGESDLRICQRFGLLPEEFDQLLKDFQQQATHDPGKELQWAQIRLARSENSRQAAEGRLQALMDISPEAILVVNATNGEIERANDIASNMFGYPMTELVGLSVEELVPSQYRHIHPVYRIRFMTSHRKREMGYHPPIFARRKDGSEVEVAVALTANGSDDTVMVVCTEFARWNRLSADEDLDATANG